MKLDNSSHERLQRKFDLFRHGKKEILFTKYPALYQLESQHEVDMVLAYNDDVAAKCFTHHIAESWYQGCVNF